MMSTAWATAVRYLIHATPTPRCTAPPQAFARGQEGLLGRLFPGLQCVKCICTGGMAKYIPQLERWLAPSTLLLTGGYVSTEGTFAVPAELLEYACQQRLRAAEAAAGTAAAAEVAMAANGKPSGSWVSGLGEGSEGGGSPHSVLHPVASSELCSEAGGEPALEPGLALPTVLSEQLPSAAGASGSGWLALAAAELTLPAGPMGGSGGGSGCLGMTKGDSPGFREIRREPPGQSSYIMLPDSAVYLEFLPLGGPADAAALRR